MAQRQEPEISHSFGCHVYSWGSAHSGLQLLEAWTNLIDITMLPSLDRSIVWTLRLHAFIKSFVEAEERTMMAFLAAVDG